MIKPTQCIYSPKSKIHVDLNWQSLFLKELGCADKFNVLIRIIHSTENANSVYADSSGIEHPGMLINYSYLSDALCLSRSTLQRILNQLEADGYINRIKLGRGKTLAQTTQKTCQLRDEIHAGSLAAKTNSNDFHKLSNNFEVVCTQQKEITGQPNLTASQNKVGQFDRAGRQELSGVGQIDRGPLNVRKVKQEKTILDNPYQDLNSIAQEKPTDCAIVSFFDNDVANGNESTKQNTFIADSNDDLKQEAIAYLQAQCPDVTASAISETIDALTARFSLTSQHEIVNAVLMTLGKITEDEAWNYDQQGRCGVAISHPETHASLQNSTPQAINNSGVGDTVSDDHAKVDQLGQDCHKSILSQRLNRVASQPNSDNLNLIEVFGVCGTDHKAMIDVRQNSTSHTDGDSEMTNTAERHHDKSTFSKQAYHKTSAANLTAEDIKMPVVEKEVLRKDWASLADQNFYEGVLPDSGLKFRSWTDRPLDDCYLITTK